jgi:hypothetical protein
VVLGHPTPYASDDIPLDEVVSTNHQALSQVQRVLCHEGENLDDECQRLQLWASMLKRMTVSERAAARARQHGFDLQVEAITQCDADSKWALADAQELYASAEADQRRHQARGGPHRARTPGQPAGAGGGGAGGAAAGVREAAAGAGGAAVGVGRAGRHHPPP